VDSPRISFPIPDSQIQDIIKHGERAPYGRGGETILDTSVRNAWQLAPANVRIGGKSWERSFQHILSTVTDGLGCTGMNVSAEFYKLLIYEEGGFFLPHRDTEKTDGMFGTVTIVFPSVHCGGELVIRHTGREVMLDLSNAETSEPTFAAFYADCERAIKPITQGSRVCLTYNVLQRRTGKKHKTDYSASLRLRGGSSDSDSETDFQEIRRTGEAGLAARVSVLKLSAEQGFADAYLMLGLAYMNIRDAPRDLVKPTCGCSWPPQQEHVLAVDPLVPLHNS
jgi:hypothetical protein